MIDAGKMIVDSVKALVPPALRQRLKHSYYRLREAADDVLGDGTLAPPSHVREYVGDGDFARIGKGFIDYFRQRAGLAPHHAVLDIGCGVGRMAIPLIGYLGPAGRYEGFDVFPYGIEWCRRKITSRFPAFRFHCFDFSNTAYNPAGSLDPATFRFPFSDGTFDFVFATSVFTHLGRATTENYVRELARCLKPGGRAVLTFLLLNEAFRAERARGRTKFTFLHARDGYWVQDPENPEGVVGYEEADVLQLLARCGMKGERVDRGAWAGADNGVSSQDIVVAVRT